MKHDTNLVAGEGPVVVALPWRGGIPIFGVDRAEVTIEVEVCETGEGEPEECAGEDKVQDEVVGLAEADGVVDLADPGVETVLWRTGGYDHGDDRGEATDRDR